MVPAGETGGTLVVQTAFLGDVVLTTPLLTRLAGQYGTVDVVTTPTGRAVLEGHPAVRDVIPYDKRGTDAGLAGFRRIVAEVRARRYVRAFLPHRSLRSASLAAAAGIPERIGFRGRLVALTYTIRVPFPADGHEADRLLTLAGPSEAPAPPVTVGRLAGDEAEARAWMASHRVEPGFIALAPGSAWGTKRWPHFGDLIQRVQGTTVIVGGPEDEGLAVDLAARARDRTFVAAGSLGLRGSTVLLSHAAVVVTNDSAPLHLAQAAGVPVVALFGPTDPGFGFGPRGRDDVVLGVHGLACRPCSRHGPVTCPLGHHRCMVDLTVEQVATEVERLLARTRKQGGP